MATATSGRASIKEESRVYRQIQPASPPRDVVAKRIELTRLWTVLPEAHAQKTLRCLARIVAGHLERKEVRDDRR